MVGITTMQKYGVVNSPTLNLRDKASTDSNILVQLTKGAALDILSDAGFGWLQVRVQGVGTVGYVSKVYLTLTDTQPSTAPTASSTPTTVTATNAPTTPSPAAITTTQPTAATTSTGQV